MSAALYERENDERQSRRRLARRRQMRDTTARHSSEPQQSNIHFYREHAPPSLSARVIRTRISLC